MSRNTGIQQPNIIIHSIKIWFEGIVPTILEKVLIRLTLTIPTVGAMVYLSLQGLKKDCVVEFGVDTKVTGDHGSSLGVCHGPSAVQEERTNIYSIGDNDHLIGEGTGS